MFCDCAMPYPGEDILFVTTQTFRPLLTLGKLSRTCREKSREMHVTVTVKDAEA